MRNRKAPGDDQSDPLARALSYLERARYESAAEARLRAAPEECHPTFGAPSREAAREAIGAVVKRYAYLSEERADGARTNEIASQLRSLHEAAAELQRAIADMHRHTVLVLRAGGARYVDPEIESNDLPGFHEAAIAEMPGGWRRRLQALVGYTAATLEAFAKNWGPDRGGNTKPIDRIEGRAEWSLVTAAWDLYEWMGPSGRGPSGSGSGPFFEFVCAVFECATGESETSGLKDRLGTLSALRRERQDVLRRVEELRATKDQERASGGVQPETWQQLFGLWARLVAVEDQIRDGVPRPAARG